MKRILINLFNLSHSYVGKLLSVEPIIEVRQAGDKFIHILRNGANKNPSYRDGTLIVAGDQEILNRAVSY